MISDKIRTDAYARALQQAVNPSSVVLDIGTGAGIWALLACQFGARKVYAIEQSDAIEIAREIAAANGYAERIEFIQERSTRVTLPERADVIISDMHGVLPLFEQNLPALIDARRRLLAPGGAMIPKKETMWITIVESPELYRRHITPWNDRPYGLDMRAALRVTTNTWRTGRVSPDQVLVDPKCWATLDCMTLESPNVSGEVTWTAARTGTGHGFLIWFDATLTDGVHFSNAPDVPELIFGSAFFPFPGPITLAAGTVVSITLHADLVGDDYLWRWNTCIRDSGHLGQTEANFKQSTFLSDPLSLTRIHRRADGHVPALSENGQIDRFALALMDGEASLREIANRVRARFPNRFVTWQDALTRIAELSEKYGL